jgi:ubiquinone/menaquinone biosynthesis C-methylase UbiE
MRQLLLQVLSRFPRLKAGLRAVRARLLLRSQISAGYVALDSAEVGPEGSRLRDSWQDASLPRRQRELVDGQLQQYRRGMQIDVFDVLVRALSELPGGVQGRSLLEVGCSSGFYSEVLDIAGLGLRYAGCDYSQAFIDLAREKYPALDFAVADATALKYPDAAFDIVVSGCCLLHIPDYAMAVAETARVAGHSVVFHRTPVVWGQPERWYRKQAYGIETVEIHFNEQAFLELLARQGLELLATYTLHEESNPTDPSQGNAVRTYACRKRRI